MPATDTIASPTLWAVTVGLVLALLALDFALTRRPHAVGMREAIAWSAFYVALPLAFGGWVWWQHGEDHGVEYLTGYVVEKSLSVDNLFVFMMLLAAFAVPAALQQRVLLYGIVGALVMRAVFIVLGAAALEAFDWVFLVFGLLLALTGLKLLRDTINGSGHAVDVERMRVVRLARRLVPVTESYDGPRLTARRTVAGRVRRALTPLGLLVLALLATDLVFAVDSVPAVYGITGDPYLVFATNAFALLGLRALYFVLAGALARLAHLGYGMAAILVLIGAKLSLHWAHLQWSAVPEVPTLASLVLIVGILAVTVTTSLLASRAGATPDEPEPEPGFAHEVADDGQDARSGAGSAATSSLPKQRDSGASL